MGGAIVGGIIGLSLGLMACGVSGISAVATYGPDVINHLSTDKDWWVLVAFVSVPTGFTGALMGWLQ